MESKHWYLSRLLWVGIAEIAVVVLSQLGIGVDLDTKEAVIAAALGIATIIFRVRTNQPVGK